ncbi:MAG: class I SAM-dependent methyltransferase [Sandaracinus sp.]|nr:class I SAM-dependent methyltransferase [Sandaracinus sp.]MCB9631618.1 class I SAM-dependent methyltransferase [Sandaracinus sp.]
MTGTGLDELLGACIPNDHAEQVGPEYYARRLLDTANAEPRVMDLGCGVGASFDLFRSLRRDVDWHGVDIEGSPESASRTRTDAQFHTYDGVHLPFEDQSFDFIYSKQVFEHVRYPEQLLGEVRRVLRPGGAFFGSVSALEPYHSLSLWSFTPYGWFQLTTAAGLHVQELRPGIDSIALIRRSYLGRPPEAATWFRKSPLNEEMDDWGAATKRKPKLINLRKLQYCGHLVFWCRKP